MNYQSFINIVFQAVQNLINQLKIVYNSMISDNIFKTIIYLIILSFIITLSFELYHILIYVIKNKHLEKKNNEVE